MTTFAELRAVTNDLEAVVQAAANDATVTLAKLQADYDAYKLSHSLLPEANVRDFLVPGQYSISPAVVGARPSRPKQIVANHAPVQGGVYRDLDIRNIVQPVGIGDVYYYDCIFRGPSTRPAGATGFLSLVRNHLRGFHFTDCTWLPSMPDFRWIGIQGYGFTVRRCDFSLLADPMQVFNTSTSLAPDGVTKLCDWVVDVDVQTSMLHDHAFFPKQAATTDPRWGGGETSVDGSHCDGIQWQGGGWVTVKYNWFTGLIHPAWEPNNAGGKQINAALMIAPDVGKIYGANITDNRFGGGAVTINIADKPAKSRVIKNVGMIKRNTMLGGMIYPPYDFKISSSTSLNAGGIQGDFGVGSVDENKHVDGTKAVIQRVTIA